MAVTSLQNDLLVATPEGLWCPLGGFHVDPWRPVPRAIVTHAHSDHVAPGCGSYLCSATGAGVLRERLGPGGGADRVTGLPFGRSIREGDAEVTLFPAGHVLGSAQVRVVAASGGEGRGRGRWVVSGDYRCPADDASEVGAPRACEPFEPVACEVFITESTFGLPIYRWRATAELLATLNAWWASNAAEGRTSVVFAYALGKAQRVLAGLDGSVGPIGVHGAVRRMCEAYEREGIAFPPWAYADAASVARLRGRGLILAPPSAQGGPWLRKFAGPGGLTTATASGWMLVRGARRRRGVDLGLVMSDHSDWPGLMRAIDATGAERIGVTHGSVEAMVRYLRECGREAFVVPTRYTGEAGDSDRDGDAEAGEGTAPSGNREDGTIAPPEGDA